MLCLAGPGSHAHPWSSGWSQLPLGEVRGLFPEEGQQDAGQTKPQVSTSGYEWWEGHKAVSEGLGNVNGLLNHL